MEADVQYAVNAAACNMTEANQNLKLRETRKQKEETLRRPVKRIKQWKKVRSCSAPVFTKR